MSLLAEVVAAATGARRATPSRDPGPGRFEDLDATPERRFVLEAVHEGYLMHYGDPRAFTGMDDDLRLLAGDALYALGLSRLAEAGDLEAVAELSDLISRSAQAQAEGRPEAAEALWLRSAERLARRLPAPAFATAQVRALRNQLALPCDERNNPPQIPWLTHPLQSPESKSRYTTDRGIAGAFEGETVTRRSLMTGTALAAGGIATAAFALPGARLRARPDVRGQRRPTAGRTSARRTTSTRRPTCRGSSTSSPDIGEAGKTTIYVRKSNPRRDEVIEGQDPQPYVAISTRCAHLGCPVRYVQASEKLHLPVPRRRLRLPGQGRGRPAGAPARPLLHAGRTAASRSATASRVNSKLERFPPRDPSNHLDGLWQYLYPSRPST